ncbi:MAG: helix-turn-helix transcriptional regulator [Candidatus Eremiobacterota bacterium]
MSSSMTPVSRVLGKQIRTVRQSRAMTMERLAELAQLSTTYVGEVERGVKEPSVTTLLKLATAMGVTLRDLLAPLDGQKGRMVGKFEILCGIEEVLNDYYPRDKARSIVDAVARVAGPRRYPPAEPDAGKVAEPT